MGSQFNSLRTTRRGCAGEKIVADRLRAAGYSVYRPDPNAPHPIDFFACKRAGGAPVAVEVKTYPGRRRYADTGLDQSDWRTYTNLALSLPVFIFWVDPDQMTIFHGEVRKIAQLARWEGDKVYFDLSGLKPWVRLTDAEAGALIDR